MSTTPRTDAARGFHDMDTAVSAEDMAKIETELVRLRAEKAEADLAAMTTCAKKLNEECELWEIRCGSIICSGVLDSYTGADLQKWEDEFKKKRGDLIARAEKAEAELATEREKVRVLREALEKFRYTVVAGGTNPAKAALDATKEVTK